MQTITFAIKGDYIELIKLLKATGIADNGGEAKNMVESNSIYVNGVVESRKRAKLHKGDKIEINAQHIIHIA